MKRLIVVLIALVLAMTGYSQTVTRKITPKDLEYKVGNFDRPSQVYADSNISRPGFTPINVLAFGVDHTGATDCRDSLQAVIDSVSAWGGGTVYMPEGSYLVNSTVNLKAGVNLAGSSHNLKGMTSGAPGGHGTVIESGITDGSAIFDSSVQGWGIYSLAIDGNDNACTGISSTYQASPDHPHHFRIEGVDIHDCAFGLDMDYSYVGAISASNIRDNTYGFRMETCNAVLFDGCAIEHNTHQGILRSSDGVTFSGCTIEGHATDGIEIQDCDGTSFIGCYFEGTGGATDLWHISAGDSLACKEVAILGGRASRVGGDDDATDYLFLFDDVDGVTIRGVSIDAHWQGGVIGTTSSTRRIDFDSHIQTLAALHDGSNTINPAYNYFSDPTLLSGPGGIGAVLTNCTAAVVTDTFRTDGCAIKFASDAASDDRCYANIPLDDYIVNQFKDRRIQGGAWIWINQAAGFVNQTSYVAVDFYGAVGGAYAGNTPYLRFRAGSWNYLTAYADVDASETSLDFRIFLLPPGYSTTAGNEYIIVDNISITDGYADEYEMARGYIAPHPSTFSGVYNVKHFGATGDGSTDDTAAIQAAIDAAEAAGGGEVYFPRGTYAIESAIACTDADSVSLGGNATIVATAANTGAMFAITTSDCFTVEDLVFDGNDLAKWGFDFKGCSELTLDGIEVFDMDEPAGSGNYAAGVRIGNSGATGGTGVTITDCYIHDITSTVNNASRGIVFYTYSSSGDCYVSDITISNCRFKEISPVGDGDGLVFQQAESDASQLVSPINATVTGCVFVDCYKRGIKVQNRGVSVSGNTFHTTRTGTWGGASWSGFQYTGISVYQGACSVTGNTFTASGGGCYQYGIEIDGGSTDCENVVVTGNLIQNSTEATGESAEPWEQAYGIRADDDGAGSTVGVVISGNIVVNNLYGYWVGNDASDIVVGQNTSMNATQDLLVYTPSNTIDSMVISGNHFPTSTSIGTLTTGSFADLYGSVVPEGAISAPQGSLYRYADADSSLFVKQTDNDATGWVLIQ